MGRDLPAAPPVDPHQVRDVPHVPVVTLATAIVTFLVSPFVIVLSLFLAMAGGECRTDAHCDAVERWWAVLNVAAWAMPLLAVAALLGSRGARSTAGRTVWSLLLVVAPVVWAAVLVNVPT